MVLSRTGPDFSRLQKIAFRYTIMYIFLPFKNILP